MNIKTTAIVLATVAGLFATGCSSVRNTVPLEPVTITGQASGSLTTPEKMLACAELASMRCHMTKVSSNDSTLVTCLDYPRCQIRFTATFSIGQDLSYTIALKEIQMEGKGHNYTVSYINRVLNKWARDIQNTMQNSQVSLLQSQLAQ